MSNTTRKNANKKAPKNNQDETKTTSVTGDAPNASQEQFDFSAPPQHLEVLMKKIRAVKKKLRKIQDIEKTLAAGKKLSAEQQRVLDEKSHHERFLKELEEIRTSLEQIDITSQIRQILGIFVAAANTSSPKLNDLAAVLLPPSIPDPDFQPLKELQHAVIIAEKFLSGSDEELFSQPRVTYSELREEVRTFLNTEALRVPVQPTQIVETPLEVVAEPEAPVIAEPVVESTPVEPVTENAASPVQEQDTSAPVTNNTDEKATSDDEKQSPKENGVSSPKELENGASSDDQAQKRRNSRSKNYRGGRRGRGTGRKEGDEKVNNGETQTNNPADSNSKQSGRGGRGRGGWKGGKSFSPKNGENKPASGNGNKTAGNKPPAKPTTPAA